MVAEDEATQLPLVQAGDIRVGVNLADVRSGQLYCVVELRVIPREGREYGAAVLENAMTGELEVIEYKHLADLRVVPWISEI